MVTDGLSTIDELRTVIGQVTGLPEAEIELDKTLVEDLGLDSLAIVEVAVALGTHFGIEIPDSDLPTLVKVIDVLRYVEAKLGL